MKQRRKIEHFQGLTILHAKSNIPVDMFSHYIDSKLFPLARTSTTPTEDLIHQNINW